MTDQFFTPESIAANLTSDVDERSIVVVADFAIGDGSLIRALGFEPKKVLGVDLDPNVINNLSANFPKWELFNEDFLLGTPQLQSQLVKYLEGVDLILLNPPFTCKGGKYFSAELNGKIYRCRTAMAFIVLSLKYLAPKGKLIAILPLSMLKSEHDLKIIDGLKLKYDISLGKRLGRNSFVGCNPNSIIISITPLTRPRVIDTPAHKETDVAYDVFLTRGATQMHKTISSGLYPVLHTTNIKNGKFTGNDRFCNNKSRYVKGKVLLITRVGLPSRKKISIFNFKRQYVLSDCLIGIQAEDPNILYEIQQTILNNWQSFALLYDSTCAPYITINLLQNFLRAHSINSTVTTELKGFQFKKEDEKIILTA